MNIDELQKSWISIQTEEETTEISEEQILGILKKKHLFFWGRLLFLEVSLPFVYGYFIVLILFRYNELKESYLEMLAIGILILLSALIVVRMYKIWTTYNNRHVNFAHLMALKKSVEKNIQNRRLYVLSILLNTSFVVLLGILLIKIYDEYEVIYSWTFWVIIISFSVVFIILIKRKIERHYTKAINEINQILVELK